MNGNTESWDMKNIELIEKYRSGFVEARDKLIMSNQGLVNKIAQQYSFNGKYELEDLIQEGNIGLIKAIDKYDNTYAASFSTYAVIWIKQSIVRYIYNSGRTIRIPVYMQEKLSELNKTIRELEIILEAEPSIYQIAKAMDISITEVQKLLIIKQELVSLDEPIGGEEEEITLLDSIKADEETPEGIVEAKDTAEILRKEIKEKLEAVQAKVILLKNGFYGKPETYRSIGERLNVSVETVRRDEQKALRKLRNCPKIRTLHVERKLNSITNFYRNTEKVVIWREKQRGDMLNKSDNAFYKWARKIGTFKSYLNTLKDSDNTNTLEEQERALAALKLAMTEVLINMDYKAYNILKRRIEGCPEDDVRKYYSFISVDEYDYYEAVGIEYVSNYLKSNGIEIGL